MMYFIRSLLLFLFICQSSFADPAHPGSIPPASVEQKILPLAPSPADTPPPPLPSSEEMTYSYQHAFIRMLLSLLGLLALVFATFWFLKRMGKGKFRMGSGHAIHILEKRSLSPKTFLYVVEIEGKHVLISESQLEVRGLTTFEPKTDLDG